MATVNATTIVRKGYEAVVLLAGDEIPEWAADQVGDHPLEEPGVGVHEGRGLVELQGDRARGVAGDRQGEDLLEAAVTQDGVQQSGLDAGEVEQVVDEPLQLLGRGLDIFQKGSGSQFDLGSRRQEFRQVFAFGITYRNEGEGDS